MIKVRFVMDLVKFEPRPGFKSILWQPFNELAHVARLEYEGENLQNIIYNFNRFCIEHDKIALEFCSSHPQFNGYKAWVVLHKGQRKPRGWNTSRSLKFEKEFEIVGETQTKV